MIKETYFTCQKLTKFHFQADLPVFCLILMTKKEDCL